MGNTQTQKKMKLFGLTVASTVFADVITIDPGCPTLWPKNTDTDTLLPYWKRECPPLDLFTRLGQGLVLLWLVRKQCSSQSRWQNQSQLALLLLQVKGMLVGDPG